MLAPTRRSRAQHQRPPAMAIRDRAGAYQRWSLEEHGKSLTGIIGPLIAELDPAVAPAQAEDKLHFLGKIII